MNERLVDVGGEESWVGVPVHQCVDLELGVFERVRRRVLHLPVDHLSDPGIQTHLRGNVVKKKTTEAAFMMIPSMPQESSITSIHVHSAMYYCHY